MNASLWSDLETVAFETLVDRCPTIASYRVDNRVAALVALMAFAQARLDADVHDNRLEAELRVYPAPPEQGPAAELLGHIACVVSDVARRARGETRLDISARLDDSGYALLMADLLGDGAREDELTRFAECVGAALTRVHKRVEELCTRHRQTVLRRDTPPAASLSLRCLNQRIEWLLAPEFSGDPSRPRILVRRAQAFALFGSLASVLQDTPITKVIDSGEPLASALARHFELTEVELRAFRGARDVRTAIEQWDDLAVAARRLKAYSVPRHEWPGAGQPDSPAAWQNSPWLHTDRTHLVRPDYLGEKEAGVQDAILALKDDLLRPLAAERMPPLASRDNAITQFASELNFPERLRRTAHYRVFLGGLHRAIVGNRKPKAFQEAAALWHRRAASLSALRHEHSAERPGWPALSPPWRSRDGRYDVVALTSASDLVIEGNEMQHCVGGYYDVCRRGDTQILSLRRDGRRALRHHLEGVEEAFAVLGPAIPNSDGDTVELRQIGLQHLDEDCGIVPRARDWLIDLDVPDWLPEEAPGSTALATASAQRFGGEPGHYRALHDWFLATQSWGVGAEHLLFRHHSFGIFEAEARFGPASMSATTVACRRGSSLNVMFRRC